MHHGLPTTTVTGDANLAAPGDLELVRRFVNTRDLELRTEALATAADLDRHLQAAGATAADLRRAVALREALRALLLANATGDPPPARALATVAAAGKLRAHAGDGRLDLVPAGSGIDAALARLVAIVVLAQADGTWPRLKACPGTDCQWALYDHTRSRTRTWCAAAKCGARTRARAYRARRRAV
jgi:predicted RNA-binding Zn ribbon-like protein